MIVPGSANALMLGQSQGYNLTKSLRFRSSASAYLNRTPGSASNRQKWTWSAWVKLGTISASNGTLFNAGTTSGESTRFYLRYTGDTLQTGYGAANYFSTSNVLRDPSAWYHIVLAYDSTQATASNRILLYINGILATYTFGTNVTLNNSGAVNNNVSHQIGSDQIIPGGYFDGYMTEINFVDGQQLTPSSFGSTNADTGVWQPARYTGTYGTNGFYLPFTDVATTSGSNAGLGKDFSGNGNYWTTNNISVTAGTTYDSMTDVPTLTSSTVANYCVLNPLDRYDNSPTDGNLTRLGVGHGGSPWSTCRATTGVSSGKWYFEAKLSGSTGSVGNNMVGVMTTTTSALNDAYGGSTTCSYQANGNLQGNNSTGTVSSAVSGDIIMVAFDVDAGKMWVGKNGTWMNTGVPASGTGNVFTALPTSPITPQVSMYGNTGDNYGWYLNFGQQGFTYTPPTGFVALNTYNLPTSTIVQGNKYMDATLYTGTGSNLTVTNAAPFQPDFIWIKQRSGAQSHCLYDSVRGVTKQLNSNNTGSEGTYAGVSAFNSNGFSIGTADNNTNGATYVGWQWQAGQGTTSSNTNGSITSTVSVNTTSGFSVVSYTGTGVAATVGHGLGVAPSMVIVKLRSVAGEDWRVYHSSVGSGSSLALNLTSAASAGTVWNNTSPTSSVFSIGTNSPVNTSGATIIAYCWAEIAGFSKFGSYTGNGSADGPFIYTGFRPKFVMVKGTDTVSNWNILDTSRDPYNLESNRLRPNLSNVEESTPSGTYAICWDGLSNGFKLRGGSGTNDVNQTSATYIYMAFAENPFKNALAR